LQYQFNDIEVDTASLELLSAGVVIPTEPQVFDLLCFLILNRDRVVSRDELIAAVWDGRIVSETTISARINAARRAVGDSGRCQKVVRTVPRRGYRFVADVEVVIPHATDDARRPGAATVRYKGIDIPANDAERVAALRSYNILDTDPEAEYDDITTMAAQISGCRYSYISFCDDTRFWLKSKHGYPAGFTERPRELSMCPATILQTELLIVENMRSHARYANLPSVKNPPHTRFYCAMPLINLEGYALGTLCVWDPGRIRLDQMQKDAIRKLARLTLTILELRRSITSLQEREEKLLSLVSDMTSLFRS
jgi:DNA-binding winged helix-turn-helix (wHTH) protein